MKKLFVPFVALLTFFTSCSKEEIAEENLQPEVSAADIEVENFIYRAMDFWYLYEKEIPELQAGYFASTTEKNEYLASFDSPEDLFYNGLVADEDRFSWIVKDYEEHERWLSGSSKSAGFRYGFAYAPGSSTKVMAYVLYVSPDGPADVAGLKRGDLISEVNRVEMTTDNYQNLFSSDHLDLGLSVVKDGQLVKNGDTISVTKTVFKEKPIAVDKVFTVDGIKIGYLYLSTFLGEFEIDDVKLNEVFGKFKSENIDELIIDLRYNGGGYSEFSADLASMVTGQFEGEIFTQEIWNDDLLNYLKQNDPEYLYSRFDNEVSNGQAINNLNLNRVYVIGTDRSYSASESFIIGLEPYIDVIHVGLNTGGKFQGSVTLYDSENFRSKKDINKNHTYALQPLINKFANANGYTDFVDGLIPDIEKKENISNLGQLGELTEPLLARTIEAITGVSNQSDALNKMSDDETLNFRKISSKPEKGLFISSKDLPVNIPSFSSDN